MAVEGTKGYPQLPHVCTLNMFVPSGAIVYPQFVPSSARGTPSCSVKCLNVPPFVPSSATMHHPVLQKFDLGPLISTTLTSGVGFAIRYSRCTCGLWQANRGCQYQMLKLHRYVPRSGFAIRYCCRTCRRRQNRYAVQGRVAARGVYLFPARHCRTAKRRPDPPTCMLKVLCRMNTLWCPRSIL